MSRNQETRTVDVILNGKQPAKTLKELNQDIRTVTASMRQLEIGSPQWDKQAQALNSLRAQMKAANTDIQATGKSMEFFKNQLKATAVGVIGGNMITAAMQSVTGYFTGAIDSMAKLSDELADIRKVTNLSTEAVDEINRALGQMDTRTPRSQLRELAWAAGKLGNQSKEDVLAFVSAADKINVALGKDLGSDAITQIGKLTDIFKLKEEFGLEQGMLKIASAVNAIGMASTANEKYLVEFAKRMSGISGIANISAPEIIGLAGTLDSLGQTSEVSSTAISKLLSKMGKDVPVFAKLAGKSVDEFRKIMDRSGLEALLAVIEQMGKSAGGLETLAEQIGEIGLDGGRVVGVLGTLAKNIDEVRRQTDIANQSFDEGTSVVNEFNIKNETAAAKLEKLQKQINSLKESSFVRAAVQGLIDTIEWLVKAVKNSAQWWEKNRWMILSLAATYVVYRAVLLKTIAAKAISLALDKGSTIAANALALVLKALIVVEELLTGKIKLKTVAQKAWLAVVSITNPYRAAMVAIAGLTTAIVTYTNKVRKAREETDKFIRNAIRDLETKSATSTQQNFLDRAAKATSTNAYLQIVAQAQEIANRDMEAISKINQKIGELYDERNALENQFFGGGDRGAALQIQNEQRIALIEKEIEETEKRKKELEKIYQISNNTIKKMEAARTAKMQEEEEKRKELTDAEIKRLKDLMAEYLKAQEELRKSYRRAGVEVLAEELERETNMLRLHNAESIEQIEKNYAEQIARARELGKTKATITQLNVMKEQEILAANAIWQRKLAETNKKFEEKLASEELQQERDNLAERLARLRLVAVQQYDAGIISKQDYEDRLAEIEIDGKQTLIDILKDYGKSATQEEWELIESLIKIRKEGIKQLNLLSMEEAEQRLIWANIGVVDSQRTGRGGGAALREQFLAAQQLLMLQLANELELTELNEAAKFEIKQRYAAEFARLQQEYDIADQQRKLAIANEVFSQLSAFANEIFGIRMDNLRREMEELERSKQKEMDLLDQAKDREYYTEAEYQQRRERLEADFAKKQLDIKRRQAAAEKAQALFGIFMETAKNIVQVFPNVALMAAAGALGALQTAAVASRPLPKYRRGKKFKDKQLKGPSHTSPTQGLYIIDPVTGEVQGLAEGGEVLLSKETYRKNPQLVDSLLDASQNNGGRMNLSSSLSNWSKPTPTANASLLAEQVRFTSRRDGATGRNPSTGAAISSKRMAGGESTAQQANYDLMVLSLDRLNDTLDRIERNGLDAFFDFERWKRELAKAENAERRGNVGP